jgi:putative nucleotidyltransferase with HDIG domain
MIWDKFQWIAFAVYAIAIPSFAVQYTGTKISNPKLVWGLASIVPIVVVIFVLADPWLRFVYPNPRLDHSLIFGELQYDFTWFVYAFAVYGYITTALAFAILGQRMIRPHRLYRAQIMAVIVGLLIPVFGTAIPLIGLRLTTLRDATPITTAIGNLFIAWGIFRYRLLDVVHIARDTIMDSISDLVIVLDEQDRIVDINPVALFALEKKAPEVIGKFAKDIFAEWPDLIQDFTDHSDKVTKATLHAYGKTYHHEVKSTVLRNRRGTYIGRVFVSRDISLHVELQENLENLNNELERRVHERTAQLEEAYDTTLEGWARALELRDKETLGHCWRVTDMTMKLALALDIPLDQFDHIRRGAILHDIGKMAIPDEILRKTGPLNQEERLIVLQHPAIAYELLSRIPFLEKALDIPYCHHEKWDGSGYPRGLRETEIPLAARIFSVVDVWDAIQSDRPYKKGWPRQQAIDYIREQAGIYFDPEVVNVFLSLVEEDKI